jgi:hypothetical protein
VALSFNFAANRSYQRSPIESAPKACCDFIRLKLRLLVFLGRARIVFGDATARFKLSAIVSCARLEIRAARAK